MHKRLCLFLLAASTSVAAAAPGSGSRPPDAAGPRDAVERLALASFRVFNDRDGLPQNTVKAMALDRDGYLWIGTQDGAAYYNGRKWHTIDMPTRAASNWINTICAASDGSVLFGTNGAGLCRLKDGAWTVFDTTSSPLRDGFVQQILEAGPEGPRFWVAGGGALFELDGDAWRAHDAASGFPEGEVTSVVASGGAVWAGTEHGVARLAGGRWETFGAAAGLPDDYVYCLAAGEDDDGAPVVWAGTDSGLARYRGGRWEAVADAGGPGASPVYSLLETPGDGVRTLWVGTPAGLFRLESGLWQRYATSTGLPDNSVVSLLEVRAEAGARALLAGTLSGGLARMTYGNWLAFDTTNGLPDHHVYSFLETEAADGGPVVWIGTYGGLARLERGEWSVFKAGAGLPNDKVNCLLASRAPGGGEAVWAGTFGGLARYESGRWSVVDTSSGLPNDSVRCVLETPAPDGSSILWVGTYGGLARREGGRWTVYDAESGLGSNQVMAIARTVSRSGAETIWAGTLGGGLARLDGGRWTRYDASSGLPNDYVRAIREVVSPDGRRALWVGTLGGAAWLDLDAPSATWQVVSDATVPALPNNVVYDVRADAAGRLYLTTNKGVARLTARTPTGDDPSPYAVYRFTTEDGLPSNECNGGASMVDGRGRVWVGTTAGAAVLDPAAARVETAAKPLHVERTYVNGDPVGAPGDVRARPTWPSLGGAELDYDHNNIDFEYALLSYFKESDTAYRTQLVGLEEAPTAWTGDAKRTFSRLPDGAYTFRVWARDYAGTVSGPVEVPFRVGTAPWMAWWAMALYGLAIAGLGYGATRVRTRSLERRNRALELRVAERTSELDSKNHELADAVDRALDSERRANEANRAKSVFLANMSHELRTPLNAILGFVQLMQRKKRGDEEDREYLRIVLRSGEHLLGLINDVLSISRIEAGKVTLTPVTFPPAEVLEAVEELMGGRAEAKGLALRFVVDGDLPACVRGDEGKLRQILINLLGNAIKFTDAGSVTLRVAWRGGRAAFEVEDTGHGIAPEEIGALFEPFAQTESGRRSTEGTGLGLTITRTFVELMGGDVRVESELGRGTVFRFEVDLPEAERVAERDTRTIVGLAPDQAAPRVLVVDDKGENRRLLVDLLGSLGFETREAADGAAAVDVFASWRPEIVLMDVRMPVMNGYEATRRIRETERERGGPRATVVALSASVFLHDRQAILDCGCDDFLPKPVEAGVLLERLGELAGVGYVYAEPEAPAPAPAPLAADGLEGLPAALLERLRRAVDAGAIRDAERAIDEIRVVDAATAEQLAALLKAYQLDEIADALGAVDPRNRER